MQTCTYEKHMQHLLLCINVQNVQTKQFKIDSCSIYGFIFRYILNIHTGANMRGQLTHYRLLADQKDAN